MYNEMKKWLKEVEENKQETKVIEEKDFSKEDAKAAWD